MQNAESKISSSKVEQSYCVPLRRVLNKNGFLYTQHARGRIAFIYAQRVSDTTTNYEVFRIKIAPEKYLPGGKIIPARERFPNNEAFGQWAWTYPTLERAMKRFNELEFGSK